MRQKFLVFYSLLLFSMLSLSLDNYAGNSKSFTRDKSKIKSSFFNLSSPDDTIQLTKRQYRNLFNEATGYFFENQFAQALPLFMQLLRYDSDNSHINFYVGACYMNLPEAKSAAIPYLQKAVKNTTIYYDYDYRSRAAPVFAYFYLAYVYRNNYKIGDALLNDKIFKAFVQPDNEELMNEVDREIKNLETGNVYAEQPEITKAYNKLFDNLIEYDVYIKNPEPDPNWWVNNLEGIKRELLVNTIIKVAYSGKVNVYDENNNILTNEQVRSIGNEPTLLNTKAPNPPYNDTIILIENQLNLQLITKMRFLEEWYYDNQTLEMGKKVVGITPLIEEYFGDNTFKGYKNLYTLYFDDKYPALLLRNKKDTTNIKNNTNFRDSLKTDTAESKEIDFNLSNDFSISIKSQTSLTERIRYDVPVKNFKSQEEWYVENIELGKREEFLKQLFDLVNNGLLQTYDVLDDSLTVKRVRELTGLRTDSIRSKSPYPPYSDTVLVVNKNYFDYDKVAKFRFLEEWYLDENTAMITKKVVGFAPLIEIYDDNKILKGYTSLFWVYFDKKYPIKVSNRIVNFGNH